jgi:hypothetical protein
MLMATLRSALGGSAAVLTAGILIGATRATPQPSDDRAALIAVEHRWLAAEHDSATLDDLLAPDFVHAVPTGDFLTKAQHIHYAVAFQPPADERRRFDTLSVRVYGAVGIVTGIVRATRGAAAPARSIFTDVFVKRNGRWRAVNAQENKIGPMPSRR